jgi:hypothetical protein
LRRQVEDPPFPESVSNNAPTLKALPAVIFWIRRLREFISRGGTERRLENLAGIVEEALAVAVRKGCEAITW